MPANSLEPSEVTVEGHDFGAMLQCKSSEMGVVHEIARRAKGGKQPLKQREVTIGGVEDYGCRPLQPRQNHTDCFIEAERICEEPRMSHKPHERQQHDPSEPDCIAPVQGGADETPIRVVDHG